MHRGQGLRDSPWPSPPANGTVTLGAPCMRPLGRMHSCPHPLPVTPSLSPLTRRCVPVPTADGMYREVTREVYLGEYTMGEVPGGGSTPWGRYLGDLGRPSRASASPHHGTRRTQEAPAPRTVPG